MKTKKKYVGYFYGPIYIILIFLTIDLLLVSDEAEQSSPLRSVCYFSRNVFASQMGTALET